MWCSQMDENLKDAPFPVSYPPSIRQIFAKASTCAWLRPTFQYAGLEFREEVLWLMRTVEGDKVSMRFVQADSALATS